MRAIFQQLVPRTRRYLAGEFAEPFAFGTRGDSVNEYN